MERPFGIRMKGGGNPFSHRGEEALMSICKAGFKESDMNTYLKNTTYVQIEKQEWEVSAFSQQNGNCNKLALRLN